MYLMLSLKIIIIIINSWIEIAPRVSYNKNKISSSSIFFFFLASSSLLSKLSESLYFTQKACILPYCRDISQEIFPCYLSWFRELNRTPLDSTDPELTIGTKYCRSPLSFHLIFLNSSPKHRKKRKRQCHCLMSVVFLKNSTLL